MHYNREKIGKYTLGTVVEVMPIPDKFGYRGNPEDIGHIVGFSFNPLKELLILVNNPNDMIKPYHPSRLLILE